MRTDRFCGFGGRRFQPKVSQGRWGGGSSAKKRLSGLQQESNTNAEAEKRARGVEKPFEEDELYKNVTPRKNDPGKGVELVIEGVKKQKTVRRRKNGQSAERKRDNNKLEEEGRESQRVGRLFNKDDMGGGTNPGDNRKKKGGKGCRGGSFGKTGKRMRKVGGDNKIAD